ncbi:MAG: DegV family protein [Bacillota bacterium]
MARVHLVTDSSSDLPRELKERYGIATVPLYIFFGDQTFRDQVELSTPAFYDKMASGDELPHTSQPSPADFLAVYQAISEPGDTIVSVHLSQKLSGTFQSAFMASNMLTDRKVIPVDSGTVCTGLGMAVLAAARAVEQGLPGEAVAEAAARTAARIHHVFALDSLEHLQRSGRIGRAAAFLGGLLAVKPPLTIENGIVAPLEKVRGKSRVPGRMVEIMEERTPRGKTIVLSLPHSGRAEESAELETQIRQRWNVQELVRGWVGPVVGANAGSGILATLWYEVE